MIRMKDLLIEGIGAKYAFGVGFAKSLSEAGHDLETDPLEGKTKTNAKNWVLGKIKKFTTGMHRDSYWKPIQDMFKEMEKLNLRVVRTGAEYKEEMITLRDKTRHSIPVRKEWTFEINFDNNRKNNDTLYGRITASGTGPVEDPLKKYDVNVTLS